MNILRPFVALKMLCTRTDPLYTDTTVFGKITHLPGGFKVGGSSPLNTAAR